MAITVSNTGYIKRTAITNYRNQRRGGKGRIGMRTREEDFVSHLFVASSHAYIMIFSDRGRAYWLKVHEIPDVGPDGRGKAIANLVSMEEGERIAALLAVKEFEDNKFIVMGTRRGVIKKTELSAFSNPRAGGIIAMGVEEGDSVIAANISEGNGEIFIGTRSGMAIRFPEGDVRPMGRSAYGVRGISLRDEDQVVAMEVLVPGGTILSVTERGYGKRTELEEYRVQSRGGIGIINIQTSDRNGKVVGIAQVTDDDELMLITQQGKILRMASKSHPEHRPRYAGCAPDRYRRRGPRRFHRATGGEGRGVGAAGPHARRRRGLLCVSRMRRLRRGTDASEVLRGGANPRQHHRRTSTPRSDSIHARKASFRAFRVIDVGQEREGRKDVTIDAVVRAIQPERRFAEPSSSRFRRASRRPRVRQPAAAGSLQACGKLQLRELRAKRLLPDRAEAHDQLGVVAERLHGDDRPEPELRMPYLQTGPQTGR